MPDPMLSPSPVQLSPVPLYHQVYGVLRQRVLDGTYPVGHQLATEDELAAEFNVSRATIRQAVGELVASNVVSRKQGRGTFVLPMAHAALGQVFRGSLADLMRETRRTRVRRVELERDQPVNAKIAEELGLGEDRLATVIRRTRTLDGEPFAYTVNFLPQEYGSLLTKKELAADSLMGILERKGVAFATARQEVRAQLADVLVAQSVGIDLGSAVLYARRLLFGADGRPIELVESWYRGDLYEYTVTLERGSLNRDPHHNLA